MKQVKYQYDKRTMLDALCLGEVEEGNSNRVFLFVPQTDNSCAFFTLAELTMIAGLYASETEPYVNIDDDAGDKMYEFFAEHLNKP